MSLVEQIFRGIMGMKEQNLGDDLVVVLAPSTRMRLLVESEPYMVQRSPQGDKEAIWGFPIAVSRDMPEETFGVFTREEYERIFVHA